MPRISDRYRIIDSDWTPYITVTSNDATVDTTTTVTGNSTYWTFNTLGNDDDNRVTVNLHDYWQEVPTYNYVHRDNLNNYITWDTGNSIWSDSRLYTSWDLGLSFEEAYKKWLKRRNKKRVIRI